MLKCLTDQEDDQNWNTKHQLNTQESHGISNNITTFARLGENTREHHVKAMSGEYMIPSPPNKS